MQVKQLIVPTFLRSPDRVLRNFTGRRISFGQAYEPANPSTVDVSFYVRGDGGTGLLRLDLGRIGSLRTPYRTNWVRVTRSFEDNGRAYKDLFLYGAATGAPPELRDVEIHLPDPEFAWYLNYRFLSAADAEEAGRLAFATEYFGAFPTKEASETGLSELAAVLDSQGDVLTDLDGVQNVSGLLNRTLQRFPVALEGKRTAKSLRKI